MVIICLITAITTILFVIIVDACVNKRNILSYVYTKSIKIYDLNTKPPKENQIVYVIRIKPSKAVDSWAYATINTNGKLMWRHNINYAAAFKNIKHAKHILKLHRLKPNKELNKITLLSGIQTDITIKKIKYTKQKTYISFYNTPFQFDRIKINTLRMKNVKKIHNI